MSRLIDADALKTKMLDYYSYSWQLREEIGDFFDNAPVVLEFDEEITKVVVRGEEYCKKPQWIPFQKRELTEEEQEMYPEWSYYLDCELPDDGEEVLISSPTWGVYKDTFNNEGSDGCYLEGDEEINDGMAWQPLPEPWKGEEE